MTSGRDRSAWLHGGKAVCLPPPPVVPRPWRIVLLGSPGVGKGTQATLLARSLGACPLSLGEVFRAAHGHASPEGSALAVAQERLAMGDIVPDVTVLGLICERSRCLHCRGGFLLDGFPRTVAQAGALDTLLATEHIALDAVIRYDLPLALSVQRLSGRRVCPCCKEEFHLATHPPKVDGLCDQCGRPLVQRLEDRPEAVHRRLAAYEATMAPLTTHYEAKGLLVPINADGRPEQVLALTLDVLADRNLGF